MRGQRAPRSRPPGPLGAESCLEEENWSRSAPRARGRRGKLGAGGAEPPAHGRRRCPRLMNMQEPPPPVRDVTGRPGVSDGAAQGPCQ